MMRLLFMIPKRSEHRNMYWGLKNTMNSVGSYLIVCKISLKMDPFALDDTLTIAVV